MRTIIPLAAAAAILAFGLTTTHAADKPKPHVWTVLNGITGQCNAPYPQFATPELLHKELRREGLIDEIKVVKDDDGNVIVVFLTATTVNGAASMMAYFASPDGCEQGRQRALQSGLLPDMADLK